MAAALISLRGVHKAFGALKVLRGIELEVAEGSTVVILGGSGSGKTVLMKHMIGLLKPDAGSVVVAGQELGRLSEAGLERLRRNFGMVFQGAALFDSMNVFENVAFPLRAHRRLPEARVREVVQEKLAVVGLSGIEERMPADLSGGMRKRVGLARAIVLEPRIVLYDEPTTGLDPITTDSVDQMILSTKKALGVTSVVISHDVASALKVADEIAFLDEGVIADRGPPARLVESRHPAVRAYLSTWFR